MMEEISFKNRSHPYVHELFKSAILYDAEAVFNAFLQMHPTTSLKNWKIVEARQEYVLRNYRKKHLYYCRKNGIDFEPRYKICDVVWTIETKDNHGTTRTKRIIHEVKTGKADVFSIYNQYKGMVYEDGSTVTGMDYLWIWGWKEYLDFNLPVVSEKRSLFDFSARESDTEHAPEDIEKYQSATKQKRVRTMSLSLIEPIVSSRVHDILFGGSES